jgi:hypothetical protein
MVSWARTQKRGGRSQQKRRGNLWTLACSTATWCGNCKCRKHSKAFHPLECEMRVNLLGEPLNRMRLVGSGGGKALCLKPPQSHHPSLPLCIITEISNGSSPEIEGVLVVATALALPEFKTPVLEKPVNPTTALYRRSYNVPAGSKAAIAPSNPSRSFFLPPHLTILRQSKHHLTISPHPSFSRTRPTHPTTQRAQWSRRCCDDVPWRRCRYVACWPWCSCPNQPRRRRMRSKVRLR